jgi:branched-chain amino acid transport system ATP-binding protein
MKAALLEVRSLTRSFGAVTAVNSVNLTIAHRERRAIIGPNGAGKTTLFNLFSGELAPSSGAIIFKGREVEGWPPEARATFGMGRTFQRSNLFPSLTALESVMLAVQRQAGVANSWRIQNAVEQSLIEKSITVLKSVGLEKVGNEPVKNLSYGYQRQLEVALALATLPDLLLLDEPTAGLSPAETASMHALIESLDRSLTIIVIEHDMDIVFALADRITVLHEGQVFAEGSPAEVRADTRVRDIYFGLGLDT